MSEAFGYLLLFGFLIWLFVISAAKYARWGRESDARWKRSREGIAASKYAASQGAANRNSISNQGNGAQ